MDLNNDRTLYDLCRRYKYFYGQVQEFKNIDGKYWNKNLRKALKEAEDKLEDTTKRIILIVLSEFINPHNTSTEFSQDVDERWDDWGFGRCHRTPLNQEYKVTIDNKELFDLVTALVRLYYK